MSRRIGEFSQLCGKDGDPRLWEEARGAGGCGGSSDCKVDPGVRPDVRSGDLEFVRVRGVGRHTEQTLNALLVLDLVGPDVIAVNRTEAGSVGEPVAFKRAAYLDDRPVQANRIGGS